MSNVIVALSEKVDRGDVPATRDRGDDQRVLELGHQVLADVHVLGIPTTLMPSPGVATASSTSSR